MSHFEPSLPHRWDPSTMRCQDCHTTAEHVVRCLRMVDPKLAAQRDVQPYCPVERKACAEYEDDRSVDSGTTRSVERGQDEGASADDDYRNTGHWAMGQHHFR